MEREVLTGKRAAFLSLGCKVNSYETEAMQRLLEGAGVVTVDFSERADIYVINTCTVTSIADRKSRQMLHRAKRMNPEAVVVAAGCYVQAAAAELKKDCAVDVLIGNTQKKEIVSLIADHFLGKSGKNIPPIGKKKEYEELKLETVKDKTRAFLKIQDGCSQFCTYCIIPYVRGGIRSRKKEDILEEARILAEQGYQEIVLTGIHLSSFGLEHAAPKERSELGIPGKIAPLAELTAELSEIPGIARIRLGSLEPRVITEEFVHFLAKTKACPHFHLSLQSGCDATLARMNRRYDTARYRKSLRLLRECFEHPAITTDVIVGFPGESREEFEETQGFLKESKFARMHIFKYSRREGTKAAAMPEQVSEEVKSERSGILLSLEEEMRSEYERYFLGQETSVLLEEKMAWEGKLFMTGHNERYVKFALETAEDLSNRIVTGFVSNALVGECRKLEWKSWKT